MKLRLLAAWILLAAAVPGAQERQPPKDSSRISITGCVRGRSLIATARSGEEPVSGPALLGQRYRLSGPKKMLSEIRSKSNFVEVTGLVKTSQLAQSGVPVGKSGRLVFGGGTQHRDPTQVDPRRDPLVNEPVLDVESWRPLPESCPSR
jgi:hypothetical protein